jgi:hypothetical protein|uniref:molecular chaperone n=1 Tax=Altererythrobacter segetis TaxID=1104773 RepID=UPI00140D8964|nr:molecular chaperone [Altererythrobacter segetis]
MRGTGKFYRTILKTSLAGLSGLALLAPSAGVAQGDLLIAPTRLVLDGRRGGEVILSNMGSEEETYRVSLELRRMDVNGNLEPVEEAQANASEKAALAMIRYAPRRVTLPPSQPQSIRISARPDADLPDGEYRVHMSFAALPKVRAVTDVPADKSGIAINLIPVYGIVMPIIIRKGELTVTAGIANPRIVHGPKGDEFTVDMTRSGNESIYGDLLVYRQGAKDPAFTARGIGVYPEIGARHATFELTPEQAAAMKGPARIEFREAVENGGALIAAVDGTLG